MKDSFRLFLLGRLEENLPGLSLTILSEYSDMRAVERIALDGPQFEKLDQRIRDLRSFIEAGSPEFDESALKRIGEELFRLLVRDSVKTLFDMAAGRRKGLLPLEIFVEDFEIAGWPWEFLYDPGRRVFLSQEFYPISRGIFSIYPSQEIPRQRGRIRILFVIGVLPDDVATTPGEEIKWIKEVLQAELAKNQIELKMLQGVGPQVIEAELQKNKYDIFHFFGHAGFDVRRKQGYLRLDRESPTAAPFRFFANVLGEMLYGKDIKLVFLNACETGRSARDEDPARSSVAAALLDRGIPAVIATQFSIPDSSAHYLASMIYNGLVAGKPVMDAMRDGRRAMYFEGKSQFCDWGIPVLFASRPDLVIFPRSKNGSPEWLDTFNEAIKDSNTPLNLAASVGKEGPSTTVERTRVWPHDKPAVIRVALIDLDAKIGFLPELIEKANAAQDYYSFCLSYLPVPAGAIRSDLDESGDLQMFIPRLERHFRGAPQRLNVDLVCCLTKCLIAWQEKDSMYYNYFAASLPRNRRVSVVSVFNLRRYAKKAGVSFAKATLYQCLSMLIASGSKWKVDYHDETVGCLFDFCENLSDVVAGLRHMKFDHAICRALVKNKRQLLAIDTLLGLPVDG